MMNQPSPQAQDTTRKPRGRRTLLIAAIAVVVLVVGVLVGSRIYAANESAKAADAPTLSFSASPTTNSSGESATTDSAASTGAAGTSTASAAGGTLAGAWTAGSGSYAGYRVEEVLNGADVTVTGRTEQVTAELTVADQQLTAAAVTVDVASITTDSDRRDEYFRDDVMDLSSNPTATFTLTEPVDVSAAANGGTQKFTITGTLAMNGATVPVTAEVEGAFSDGAAQIVGQIPVTWSDFGVTAPNLGFVSVENTGQIEFSLNLAKG